jgi:hypothetical protein
MPMPRTFEFRRFLAAALVALAAGLPATARAQSDVPVAAGTTTRVTSLYHKFEVTAAFTGVILNSNIRLDSNDGSIGTDLDAEDDLGLDTFKPQPRAAMRWRPGRRHELETGYQFARRSSEKDLERTIDFGDSTLEAGIHVTTRFDTDQAFLNYRFAVVHKEATQFGLALGVGAIFIDMGLAGDANLGAGTAPFDVSSSVTGPLGSLGIYGRFLSGDRWYFEGDARAVKIEIDRFDVEVIEANLAARYFLNPKWGIEAGAGGSGVTVDIAPKTEGVIKPSARVKYSLDNVRLGIVWLP